MLDRILVAVDGSDGSARAARFAAKLAQKTGAKTTLLFVLEPPPVVTLGFADAYGVTGHQPGPEEVAAGERSMEELALEFPPGQVETVVEIGAAAQVICEQAESRKAELVVVGARGLGPVGRWLVGSVSDRVVHHCKVPVTVVR